MRARLAGWRHRGSPRRRIVHRALAGWRLAGDQILDLIPGQRLVFDQALREDFKIGALLGENFARELVAFLDETLDLGIDFLDRVFRDFCIGK